MKKTSLVKSNSHTFVEKLSKIKVSIKVKYQRKVLKQSSKVLKENSIIGRSWSSANLFIVQNYIKNANALCL